MELRELMRLIGAPTIGVTHHGFASLGDGGAVTARNNPEARSDRRGSGRRAKGSFHPDDMPFRQKMAVPAAVRFRVYGLATKRETLIFATSPKLHDLTVPTTTVRTSWGKWDDRVPKEWSQQRPPSGHWESRRNQKP